MISLTQDDWSEICWTFKFKSKKLRLNGIAGDGVMLAEIIEQSGERRELATDGRGRQVAGHSPNYVHLAKQRRDFAVEAERIFVVVQEAHQESVDAHTALWMPTLPPSASIRGCGLTISDCALLANPPKSRWWPPCAC